MDYLTVAGAGIFGVLFGFLLRRLTTVRKKPVLPKVAPLKGDIVEFEMRGYSYTGVFENHVWSDDPSVWEVNVWDGADHHLLKIRSERVTSIQYVNPDHHKQERRDPATYRG